MSLDELLLLLPALQSKALRVAGFHSVDELFLPDARKRLVLAKGVGRQTVAKLDRDLELIFKRGLGGMLTCEHCGARMVGRVVP